MKIGRELYGSSVSLDFFALISADSGILSGYQIIKILHSSQNNTGDDVSSEIESQINMHSFLLRISGQSSLS